MESNKHLIDYFNKEIQAERKAKEQIKIKCDAKIQNLKQRHKKEIKKLTEDFEKLLDAKDQEIAELNSLLNTDSTNSSIPPSMDPNKNKKEKSANKYNSRKPTNRKVGGQRGHKGVTLTKEHARELIESGRAIQKDVDLGDSSAPVVGERYIYDVEVQRIITKLVIHEGADTSGIPKAACSYGDNIKSLAVLLYSEADTSNDKIASILGELTENFYPISTGFVYDTLRTFGNLSKEVTTHYLEELQNSGTLYTDATSMPVDKDRMYIRNISNGFIVVYIPMENKTIECLMQVPVLPFYKGNLVHDHETALYNYRLCQHFECLIHLIRRLKKNLEDTENTWQDELIKLLVETNNKLKEDSFVLSDDEFKKFTEEYDGIIERGYEQNQATRVKKFQKKEKSLLNDLKKYKDNYTGFACTPGVGFTNNLSERDLRKIVCRRKMVHCLRKTSGLEMTCNILSVTETLKKQKKPLLKELKKIFTSATM